MSDIVISAENLSKRYLIGHQSDQRGSYKSLRDIVGLEARNFVRKATDLVRGRQIVQGDEVEELWALRDVSFEVREGEVVGIIGRNGAGKSTLLKILSRITEPTKGRIRLRGRIGSLLEVGTGFHPELTGRENVFLNGAILGMTQRDIRKKFNSIIAFANLEKFVDTPVKRYSSGMYVRLAFAVAAHLEPEILVVDEILAVGDTEFQKKCLGKMNNIATEEGRTVIFVSHNMAALAGLCGPALWLADGMVVGRGPADELVGRYLSTMSSNLSATLPTRRHAGDDLRVEDVQLLLDDIPSANVQAGQSCVLRIHYRMLTNRSVEALSCSVMLFAEGQKLANLWTNYHKDFSLRYKPFPKHGFVDCHIRKWPFRNLTVRVDVYTHIGPAVQDWIEEALIFHSHDGDFYASGIISNPDQGILFLDHGWSVADAAE